MRLISLTTLVCHFAALVHLDQVTAFSLQLKPYIRQECTYRQRGRSTILPGATGTFHMTHGWHMKSDEEDDYRILQRPTNVHPWRYRIIKVYNPLLSPPNMASNGLPETLVNIDPDEFPTISQAKKACQHGRILIIRNPSHSSNCDNIVDYNDVETGWIQLKKRKSQKAEPNHALKKSLIVNWDTILDDKVTRNDTERALFQPLLAKATSLILHGDIFAIQTRVDDEFYPVEATKFVLPPDGIDIKLDKVSNGIAVVYEDDSLALVNKPENLTTISGNKNGDGVRNDLQSMLGFILQPPTDLASGKVRSASDIYYPRPVHRLDRRTSGLVLVAKSHDAMKRLSKSFAQRTVQKCYTALVFHEAADLRRLGNVTKDVTDWTAEGVHVGEAGSWNTVDYPIEGKPAQSDWRIVKTNKQPVLQDSRKDIPRGLGKNNETSLFLSLVEVRPRTGRTHQIRRHLAYCVGWPIVGDSKYDKGSTSAKKLRVNGMYLCCHSLDFSYTLPPQQAYIESRFRSNLEQANKLGGDGNVTSVIQYTDEDGQSRLRVTIPLPAKFDI